MGLMANQTLQKKRLENCKTQQQKLIKTKHSKKKKNLKSGKSISKKKGEGWTLNIPIYIYLDSLKQQRRQTEKVFKNNDLNK